MYFVYLKYTNDTLYSSSVALVVEEFAQTIWIGIKALNQIRLSPFISLQGIKVSRAPGSVDCKEPSSFTTGRFSHLQEASNQRVVSAAGTLASYLLFFVANASFVRSAKHFEGSRTFYPSHITVMSLRPDETINPDIHSCTIVVILTYSFIWMCPV